MNSNVQTVTDAALALPDAARADLAEILISSLDPDEQSRIDAAWKEEISRRRIALQRGEANTISEEEVMRKLKTPLAAVRTR